MNHFSCKKCNNYHKGGHCTDPSDKIREQRDELRRENNKLKRQLYKPIPAYSGYVFSNMGDYPVPKDRGYNKGFEEGKKSVIEEFSKQPPPVSEGLVVAYRVWGYHEGLIRSSAYSNFSWPQRKALGKDLYHDKGIHAVKEYKQIIPLLQEYHPIRPEGYVHDDSNYKEYPGIGGSVYLWGEVKEYEKGWMAEYAYPKEFYLGEDADMLTVMQLEEDYGVPVILRKELNKEELKRKDIYGDLGSCVLNYTAILSSVINLSGWKMPGISRTFFSYDLGIEKPAMTTALAKIYRTPLTHLMGY